jgi:subtilisin-like proprotein convertase family protein
MPQQPNQVPFAFVRRFARIRLILAGTAGVLFWGWGGTSAVRAVSLTNSTPITINAIGNATPYPSSIVVSGLSGTVASVGVTLNGFSHTFPDDVGVVLVSPTGAALLLMDGAGQDQDMAGVTFTFADGFAALPSLTAWVAGTYKPTAYYTDSFPAPGPGTTYGNPGPVNGGTATFASTFNGTSPNGTWNLYVVDFVAGNGGSISGGWTLNVSTGGQQLRRVADFNGDNIADFAVARLGGGSLTWYILNTSYSVVPFGASGTDLVIPSDYDGDGKTDVAVVRLDSAATWYWRRSSDGTTAGVAFGLATDDARVVGDYDGDGKADPAVYRAGESSGSPSFWYAWRSSTGTLYAAQFGQEGDFPCPGDYDGDNRYDLCVQRNAGGGSAVFYILPSGGGPLMSILWGTPTDIIVPGDYDGDNKTDIAVRRNVSGAYNWYIRRSTDGGMTSATFGLGPAGDMSVQGDYNGDGRTDIAVWRPSPTPGQASFYVLYSGSGTFVSFPWGLAGDVPVAWFNTH